MARNKSYSKSDVKKLNKVYKKARERVHHCDIKRLDPLTFCDKQNPLFADVCLAIDMKDRGKIAELFLSLNQENRERVFAGQMTENDYANWCEGIRMVG